jgi:hypothetical protein
MSDCHAASRPVTCLRQGWRNSAAASAKGVVTCVCKTPITAFPAPRHRSLFDRAIRLQSPDATVEQGFRFVIRRGEAIVLMAAPCFAGAHANRRDFREAFFILALARNLSCAHCAQPQGPRTGRSGGREPHKGVAARGGVPRSQPDDGASRFDRRRRAGLVRVFGDHRISRRDASEPAATAARRAGPRACAGTGTNRRLRFTPP